MAIYHLSCKVITRSAGRSSVAAAAYRSGDTLTNEWDGITHDYSRKGWIEYSEIMLPENAPEAYKDRNTLWNAVEMAEKSSNAQLAREVEVALPEELTLEQQIELVEEYVKENFTSKGMICDFSIHNPPVTNGNNRPVDADGNRTNDPEKMVFRNPHCHIMLTMRPLNADGQWEDRYQKCYICKRGEEEKTIPFPMMALASDHGWKKQYRYKDGSKQVWLTRDEGREKGYEPVDRDPKSVNRVNPTMAEWNSKDSLMQWRSSWAECCNDAFERYGINEKLDARSYEAQGIAKVPTLHLGYAAYRMEKRGIRTDRGDFNRQVKADNEFLESIRKRLEEYEERETEALKKTAVKLESLRAQYIVSSYQDVAMSSAMDTAANEEKMKQEALKAVAQTLEETEALIENLQKILAQKQAEAEAVSPLKRKQQQDLEDEILDTENRINNLKEKLKELKAERTALEEKDYDPELAEARARNLQKIKERESKAYKDFYYLINENKTQMAALKDIIRGRRTAYDEQVDDAIREHYGGDFSNEMLRKARTGAPDIFEDVSSGMRRERRRA